MWDRVFKAFLVGDLEMVTLAVYGCRSAAVQHKLK